MTYAPTAMSIVVLFVAMLVLLSIGHRLGARRIAETEQERVGLVSVETAIFGLLGLVLAFTYSGASTHYEQRRAIAIEDANVIGTAWLRLDLVAPPAQAGLKDKMRRAGAAQVAAYQALPDLAAFEAHLTRAKALQAQVWSGAVGALHGEPPQTMQLVLPAINDWMDSTTRREALVNVHTPGAILSMLVGLALFCSVLAGYGLAGAKSMSRYLHMTGFAIVVSGTVYIVLDYDFPRVGFITVDFADAALESAVAAMK